MRNEIAGVNAGYVVMNSNERFLQDQPRSTQRRGDTSRTGRLHTTEVRLHTTEVRRRKPEGIVQPMA